MDFRFILKEVLNLLTLGLSFCLAAVSKAWGRTACSEWHSPCAIVLLHFLLSLAQLLGASGLWPCKWEDRLILLPPARSRAIVLFKSSYNIEMLPNQAQNTSNLCNSSHILRQTFQLEMRSAARIDKMQSVLSLLCWANKDKPEVKENLFLQNRSGGKPPASEVQEKWLETRTWSWEEWCHCKRACQSNKTRAVRGGDTWRALGFI